MDEYISKKEAIKELREVYENEYPMASGDFDEYASHDVPNILRNMKAADVHPVDRWISVKDRLPEEGVSVLICTNEGTRSVSARYGNRFFITIVEAFTEDTVTHWQPLPEPPQD